MDFVQPAHPIATPLPFMYCQLYFIALCFSLHCMHCIVTGVQVPIPTGAIPTSAIPTVPIPTGAIPTSVTLCPQLQAYCSVTKMCHYMQRIVRYRGVDL